MLAAAALSVAVPATAELDINRAEVTHLADGLTVIMLEDHSFPVVSVQMLYKSGSAAETSGKTGLAHFMEHLAFRGSQNFPNERATELIYDAGGEWHGYTAFDQTTYFATMPKDGLRLLLDIEADRMARTVIDPRSMDAERGAVVTELHSYENDSASVLQDAVARTAIQAHPYGSPMAGYVSDVEHLTADDARAYYGSHYAPGNAVLAIVGDFVPTEAHALVAKAFADVPARPVAQANYTEELPQRGERRIELAGPVERQYFLVAFPSPAASNADLPAYLLLQQLLSGGAGLNLHQSDWSATPTVKGSALSGIADDIATFLPPTHDPFLFTISASIPPFGNRAVLERQVRARIATIAAHATPARLSEAKAAVIRELVDNVQTTEDAAHQLAFFEGIGALHALLSMPQRIRAVTAADVLRVARTYLRTDQSTVGWMLPGAVPPARSGASDPKQAADRPGSSPKGGAAPAPQLRHLSNGLPAIVQSNPLSDRATVELVLTGPVDGGIHPQELPGLDAVVRSGTPENLQALVSEAVGASRRPRPHVEQPSQDPETRLQQLLLAQIRPPADGAPKPLAIIVSGRVEPGQAFAILERDLGQAAPGKLATEAPSAAPQTLRLVRERITKPLSQGALGYVVEGPPNGTREALAWRLLLYDLTHDYSGRLGRSAITDKGIVYHIYSDYRTDGQQTWATISTGVDPEKADAMEAELHAQLANLANDPPSPAELDAARNHMLGRDLSAAQSNDEFAAKLARDFVETGGLKTHERLRADLSAITVTDLATAAQAFGKGTIVRVDVD